MAQCVLTLDDGTTIEIMKTSVSPLMGGIDAAVLLQAAYHQALVALGLSIQAPKEGEGDGGGDGGAGDRPGRDGSDLPVSKAGDARR
jgi:hypothetical protein